MLKQEVPTSKVKYYICVILNFISCLYDSGVFNQLLQRYPQPFFHGFPLRSSKLVNLYIHVSLENPQIVLEDFEHENAPDSCITNCQGLYG